MSQGIVDTCVLVVHPKALAPEFDILGISILSHLIALPQLFSKEEIIYEPTIRFYGQLLSRPNRRLGFLYGWVGKAFEYAVAELFNSKQEPHYSLIYHAIKSTLDKKISGHVSKISIDIDNLICVRVAKECPNALKLKEDFGHIRLLERANTTIKRITEIYPDLEKKVDVVFCDKDYKARKRFGILASLKVTRERLFDHDSCEAFENNPLHFAISVAAGEFEGVKYDPRIGCDVVYLSLNAAPAHYSWVRATKIVDQALIEGNRNALIRYFVALFKPDDVANAWVEILANNLQTDIRELIQIVREKINLPPLERFITVPVLAGAEADATVDLTC